MDNLVMQRYTDADLRELAATYECEARRRQNRTGDGHTVCHPKCNSCEPDYTGDWIPCAGCVSEEIERRRKIRASERSEQCGQSD